MPDGKKNIKELTLGPEITSKMSLTTADDGKTTYSYTVCDFKGNCRSHLERHVLKVIFMLSQFRLFPSHQLLVFSTSKYN